MSTMEENEETLISEWSIHNAVAKNDTEQLELLLKGEDKINIDKHNDEGKTALYIAVDENRVEQCHLLLHHGADPNVKSGHQTKLQTPLHVAATNNNSKLVALLLEYGASWYIKNSNSITPLEMALLAQADDVVHIIDTYAKDRECELRKSLEDKNTELACRVISQLPEDSVRKVLSKGFYGCHSFLFKACEDGDVDIVDFLLDNGCDIGIHPVTGQSPLHAACASGQVECAKLVLQNFPELIRAPTIDGILPLHTTCIVGHLDILRLILNFNYPDPVMKMFKELNGNRMYRLGFAINAKDGHGRTPLHIACMMNHPDIVEELLNFKVRVCSKYSEREGTVRIVNSRSVPEAIRTRPNRGESIKELGDVMNEGLNQLMGMNINEPTESKKTETEGSQASSSSNKTTQSQDSVEEGTDALAQEPKKKEEYFSPVCTEIDSIDLDGNTPLHIVIKNDGDFKLYRIAKLLLSQGANPDKPMVSPSGNLFPLTHACFNGDAKLVEILLNHGATDPDMKAFTTALKNQNEDAIGAFLKAKNHIDTTNRVNLVELIRLFKGDQLDSWQSQTVTLRYVWPNTAVSLNWHGLSLPFISSEWLKGASLQHNKKKPRATLPNYPNLVLFAITRIDISQNNLTHIPEEMCQLPSLRYLNASQNKIKWLPGCEIQVTRSCSCALDKIDCTHIAAQQETVEQQDLLWNCPLVEEINLQSNKLASLPRALFRKEACQNLKKLNVSHNEIEKVPPEVWTSPSLTDLNLSYNHITELGFTSISRSSSIVPSSTEPDSLLTRPRSVRVSSSSSTDTAVSSNISSSDVYSSKRDSSASELVRLSYTPSIFQSFPVRRISYWFGKLKLRTDSNKTTEQSKNSSKMCQITDLNLSHNLIEHIPEGLPCVVPQLDKLDLSFNRIKSIPSLGSLPAGMSELDLSHNQLEAWISQRLLMEIEDSFSLNSAVGTICYGQIKATKYKRTLKSSTNTLHCVHQSHTQLEKLKVLRLHHNQIVKFSVRPLLGKDGHQAQEQDFQASSDSSGSHGSHGAVSGAHSDQEGSIVLPLYFPALSILDLSNNLLSTVDKDIVSLTQLSELKLAHNEKLVELPPEMGLFKKLWNLDIKDCPVQRTLQALMGDSIKRTATILLYLKSVKENASLYNRMKLMFVGIQGIGKTSLLEQLRKEGSGTNRKYKNWSQRMGQSTIQDRGVKGENISTVGVDIGDLVLQRFNRKVVFSTWDFGGQREYYATHQYFLSKRSLYLVVWKLTDGEKGVHQILQWLVNIQARATNAPVIIVGTHLDMITRKYPQNYVQDLRQLIVDKYMNHTEPEKSGLPRVLACIEVSTKSKLWFNNHILDLVNLIVKYSIEEQLPGSKGVKLLDQKVPASYVRLENVVKELADERKISGKDPVLHAEQYKTLVMHKLEEHYRDSFSDLNELHQATQFLHENGILLHYDDVNLQDVYFLDPQWLCDVLANVVTIREINSLAKSGIMRTDDLKVLFKNAAFRPEDIKAYIISLLNKFEVALMWDDQNLLIPSMLPSENDYKASGRMSEVRIPVLGSNEASPSRETYVIHSGITQRHAVEKQSVDSQSNFFVGMQNEDEGATKDIPETKESNSRESTSSDQCDIVPEISVVSNPTSAIVRLYLMSYFPSGFWPRLITRLLGDSSFYTAAMSMYDLPDAVMYNENFMKTQGTCPYWLCWQTGLKLKYLGATLFKVKEQIKDSSSKFCDYHQCQLVTSVDHEWAAVDVESTSVLEIVIPNQALSMTMKFKCDQDEMYPVNEAYSSESVVLRPSPQVVAVLLTKVVEHVDNLLEDWYPDLGSRFIQNSRGMYLITRLVPCTKCLVAQANAQHRALNTQHAWEMVNTYSGDGVPRVTHPVLIEQKSRHTEHRFTESCPSHISKYDSSNFTWSPEFSQKRKTVGGRVENKKVSAVTFEECIITSGEFPYAPPLNCQHGNLILADSAADVVFQDLDDSFVVDSDLITRKHFLGRGAFGAVYAGTVIDKHSGKQLPIAMKMMQPVEPDSDASVTQHRAYKVEKEKWNKDPLKHSCEAYLNLRKELSILLSLQHEHIVGLLGISLHPLCLLLNLAPQGSLGDRLQDYNRVGNKLAMYTIQRILIQVSSALSYLHANQIIYRDLKSENVLVWSMPSADHPCAITPVDVKLADYGVSRSVLSTGTKGLAGTPPFMAPEIVQHNGEESYTEKVDCFSFGMFMYELLTLKTPFEGEASSGWGMRLNRDNCILSGVRPSITQQELVYPTHVFDLMVICWAHDPNERPSAFQIEKIAQSSEFCQLCSVLPLEDADGVRCAVCAPHHEEEWEEDEDDLLPSTGDQSSYDFWVSTQMSNHENILSVYTFLGHDCIQNRRLELDRQCEITVMCVADEYVWCADSKAIIHVYSVQTYKEALNFKATSRPGLKVKSIVHSQEDRNVYIVMDNGSFAVCDSYCENRMSSSITQAFYNKSPSHSPEHLSLVKTECPGNGKPIHCIVALSKANSELWCGQDKGKMSIWQFGNDLTSSASSSDPSPRSSPISSRQTPKSSPSHGSSGKVRVVSHPLDQSAIVNLDRARDVIFLTTSVDEGSALWTYIYPGTTVYRWDVASRQVSHSVDIAQFIPASPPPSIEKHIKKGRFESAKCQVTAMCYHGDHLFLATTLGCMFVLHGDTMAPVSIIHSHNDNVRVMMPLICPSSIDMDGLSASSSAGSLRDEANLQTPIILSIGKGYGDMIGRLVPKYDVIRDQNAHYMLLWRANSWKELGAIKFHNEIEK